MVEIKENVQRWPGRRRGKMRRMEEEQDGKRGERWKKRMAEEEELED